jgi:hypothetical protein
MGRLWHEKEEKIMLQEAIDEVQSLFTSAHPLEARRARAWLDAHLKKSKSVKGGFTVDNVLLTPVLAEVCLELMFENRPLRRSNIARLERSVGEGRWVPGVQRVMFDVSGKMIGAQHTCRAVIRKGKGITVDFRFGLPTAARLVDDTGVSRSTSDAFHIVGEKNCVPLATASKLLHTVLNGRRSADNDEMVRFLTREHPELRDSQPYGEKVYRELKDSARVLKGPLTVAHAMIVEACEGDPQPAHDWFNQLATGLWADQRKHSGWALRKLLQDSKNNKLHDRHRSEALAMLAAIIIAWNRRHVRTTTSNLLLEPGEEIPVVDAWSD